MTSRWVAVVGMASHFSQSRDRAVQCEALCGVGEGCRACWVSTMKSFICLQPFALQFICDQFEISCSKMSLVHYGLLVVGNSVLIR